MTLLTVKKSRQDPNPLYPLPCHSLFSDRYGHGKVEALGAMGIACFLLATSVMIGWDSFQAFQDIFVNHKINDYATSGSMLTYWVHSGDRVDLVERTRRAARGRRLQRNPLPRHEEDRFVPRGRFTRRGEVQLQRAYRERVSPSFRRVGVGGGVGGNWRELPGVSLVRWAEG